MKVVGTVICVGGTMVISLYKGQLLHLWPTNLLKPHLQAVGAASSVSDHHNMVIGTLFLAGSSLSYAFWFIIQVAIYHTHVHHSRCRINSTCELRLQLKLN